MLEELEHELGGDITHRGVYYRCLIWLIFFFSLEWGVRGFLGGRLHSYQLYLLLGSVPYIFHVVNSVCQCVCVWNRISKELSGSHLLFSFFFFLNHRCPNRTSMISEVLIFHISGSLTIKIKFKQILKNNVAVKQSRPLLSLIHNHTCTHTRTHTHTHTHTHTQPHMHTHNHTHTHSAAPENKIHTSIMYTSTKMHAHITLSLFLTHTHFQLSSELKTGLCTSVTGCLLITQFSLSLHTLLPIIWVAIGRPVLWHAVFWSHHSVYRFSGLGETSTWHAVFWSHDSVYRFSGLGETSTLTGCVRAMFSWSLRSCLPSPQASTTRLSSTWQDSEIHTARDRTLKYTQHMTGLGNTRRTW